MRRRIAAGLLAAVGLSVLLVAPEGLANRCDAVVRIVLSLSGPYAGLIAGESLSIERLVASAEAVIDRVRPQMTASTTRVEPADDFVAAYRDPRELFRSRDRNTTTAALYARMVNEFYGRNGAVGGTEINLVVHQADDVGGRAFQDLTSERLSSRETMVVMSEHYPVNAAALRRAKTMVYSIDGTLDYRTSAGSIHSDVSLREPARIETVHCTGGFCTLCMQRSVADVARTILAHRDTLKLVYHTDLIYHMTGDFRPVPLDQELARAPTMLQWVFGGGTAAARQEALAAELGEAIGGYRVDRVQDDTAVLVNGDRTIRVEFRKP